MKQSGTDKIKVGVTARGVREVTKDELKSIAAGIGTNDERPTDASLLTGTNGTINVGSGPG